MSFDAPTDNLVRALTEPAQVRDADGDGRTMFGHFAVFDRWTEIDSWLEGRFMERIAPGAFSRTIAEHRDRIKVLYDHGKDPSVGNKPLGRITDLREDKTGAYYEVELLDAGYVNDLIPAARAGLLGASFRFRVVGEDRVEPKAATRANPERLMERTITDVDLYEFGPVTFPAYASATAGVRSRTDEFFEALKDPLFVVRLTERVGPGIVERLLLTSAQPTARDNTALDDGDDPEGVAEIVEIIEAPEFDVPEVSSDDVDEEPGSGERAADGPSHPHIPTDLASRKMLARQIEAFRMGLGKGY